jgi:hypothetical protein
MNAYDIYQSQYGVTIGNFNVMSHTASRFAKPLPDGTIKGGETKEEWLERYNLVLDIIESLNIDILALEEVSNEFFQLLKNLYSYYIIYKPHPNNLAVLVKKTTVLQKPVEIPINFEHKYSKVQGISVILANNIPLNIYNVQLNGNPVEFMDRRRVIDNLENPDIIIGDFNEDKNLFRLHVNTMPDYNIEGLDFSTSYSRFLVKGKKVVEIKENPWENIDNIIYKKYLRMAYKQIYPNEGLYGKQVPYHMTEPFHFVKNYYAPDGWPSDHSIQVYTFLF